MPSTDLHKNSKLPNLGLMIKKQVKEKKRLYRKIPQSADIDRFLPIKQLDRLVKLTGMRYQLIWGDSNSVTENILARKWYNPQIMIWVL